MAPLWLRNHILEGSISISAVGSVGNTPYSTVTDPFVTGFEAARPDQSASKDLRPTGKGPLDYYYHPDAMSGASNVFDWYSFGVVLLEIAYWKPISQALVDEVPEEKRQDLHEINKVCTNAVAKISVMAGSMFADVTSRCLNCALPKNDDLEMARIVATQIVQVLARLRA